MWVLQEKWRLVAVQKKETLLAIFSKISMDKSSFMNSIAGYVSFHVH